ncbi:MAG: DUF2809 domain-containing protein [Burkholderiales bacterium]|nr:DUF2809 domain-containing protein [Burkholderiales bacterium]
MSARLRYALIAIAIFIIEVIIAIRLVDLSFIRGSVGDFLVVALIYFFMLSLKDWPRKSLALWVFVFACLVEITQYFHLADMLGLRRGSVIYILLGNVFSWQDIAMYLLGTWAAYGVDVKCLNQGKA